MSDFLSLFRLRLCLLGLLQTRFGVGDGIAATRSKDQIGVLYLELCEVLLGVPYPWRVGFE